MNNYDLIGNVINSSESSDWEFAVQEWEIIDCEEDETCSGNCVCGKENLKYLFTIRNKINGNILFPIGSSCIKKFGQDELSELTDIYEAEFKLFHAVAQNSFLKLKGGLFTRKLLYHLYQQGAFVGNEYNHHCGRNDYQFILDMFNKRTEPTEKQNQKVIAILLGSIKPFIQGKLKDKINRSNNEQN